MENGICLQSVCKELDSADKNEPNTRIRREEKGVALIGTRRLIDDDADDTSDSIGSNR